MKISLVAVLAFAPVLLLAGCGDSAGSSSDGKATSGDSRVWPPTGEPVSKYSAGPSYKMRVNLLDHKTKVDATLHRFGFDDHEYTDLLNICMEIGNLKGANALTDYAVKELSNDVDQATRSDAATIVKLARSSVC